MSAAGIGVEVAVGVGERVNIGEGVDVTVGGTAVALDNSGDDVGVGDGGKIVGGKVGVGTGVSDGNGVAVDGTSNTPNVRL